MKRNLTHICAVAMIVFSTLCAVSRPVFAQSVTSFYYFTNVVVYGTAIPYFYVFRSDGTGLRTSYPTGQLSFGENYPFAWSLNNNILTLKFDTGYTEIYQVTAENINTETFATISSSHGSAVWYGCRSGKIPLFLEQAVCH